MNNKKTFIRIFDMNHLAIILRNKFKIYMTIDNKEYCPQSHKSIKSKQYADLEHMISINNLFYTVELEID